MSGYSVVAAVLLVSLTRGLPEDDFRILNGQDLLATDSDVFVGDGGWYSQLLFDVARDQVVVGARDTLYRLSLRGLKQLERAAWPAPPDKAQLCQTKGQSEMDCHNYIKVLLAYGHKLFVCGTYAFSPTCSWREIESINLVSEVVSGVARCPLHPRSNVTAILTSSGEYYAGTPTDIGSSDTTICRTRGAATSDPGMLRTTQYDPTWLNEPQFVGSFEDDRYVYFVFRELAVEYLNCGKTIYSRIARVCKNDQGGHLMMKDNWTTFLKARLRCSVPGDLHFYYDEIQSVEYIADEKILVAVFTTPTNSIAGSAVCVYNMSAVHAAFEGQYKVQDSPTSTWEARSPSQETREHFRCNLDMRGHQAIEYHKYHLMHDLIEPVSGRPVYTATLERFTRVTVDVAATKTARQLVAFVATETNDVIKMAILPRLDGACVVERWRFGEQFDILNMQFVKDTMSVYIGTSTRVIRAGASHCGRYATRAACLHAADPHCGWDVTSERCVRARDVRQNLEQAAACPAGNAPVDGGWSSWSEWAPCMQEGTGAGVGGAGGYGAAYDDERPAMCVCRQRRCDNPAPAHGGQACKGVSISVANCTVHGGWSAWSDWSGCSASCGIALKTRRRACASPAPRHGGRVCVGLDQQQMYCTSLPPCPDPTLAPVDGAWGAWGPWSACSANGASCGAGVRERRRACNDPKPSRGGADCEGAPVEHQPCELRPCDVRKATAWTPWVHIPGNTSDGSYTEKRFKFLCKAPAPEQLRLSIAREEERYCTASGACSGDEDGWEAWGPWGACSAPCGGGQQARARRCRRAACAGPADMLRACNTHACQGEWSCWSDWSECAGGCAGGAGAAGAAGAAGHRTRTRMCLSPDGCADAGAALERRVCLANCNDVQSDVGWGDWGEWSECAGGERVRRRACTSGACVGAQLQVTVCGQDMDNELYAMPAYSQNVEMASFVTTSSKESLSVGAIIGCVAAAFVMGGVVSLAGVALRRRGRRARVPSSPHYITKQNSYVTVPLRDVPPRKAKRQPSFSGVGTTSLMMKSNNLSNNHNTAATPKLYPKAIANEYDSMGTLRRHSNQPNNKTDVEEDKFY